MKSFMQHMLFSILLAMLFSVLVFVCIERGRTLALQEVQERRIAHDAHCAYCDSYGHVSPAPEGADKLVKRYGRIMRDTTKLLSDVKEVLGYDKGMDDTIRIGFVFGQSSLQELRACAGTRKAQLQGTNVVFNISKESLESLEALEERK